MAIASPTHDAPERSFSVELPPDRMTALRYARPLGVAFVVTAIAFGIAAFAILLGLTPIEPTDRVINIVVAINVAFGVLLGVLVSREVARLISARRKGRAAARLHIRLVGLFGIVAALPAIIVAVVAGITLDLGLDRIFDTRSRTIVDNSIQVAESYVQEAVSSLNAHTVNMGVWLNRNRSRYEVDRQGFVRLMSGQSRARGLMGAAVVRQSGEPLVTVQTQQRRAIPAPPPGLLKDAADGRPSCIQPKTLNIAACAFRMRDFGEDTYLYALSLVDPTVLNSIQLMGELTNEYEQLESGRWRLQLAFALLYVGMCLVVLLSAIWMGLAVADRLVTPIRRLIIAADQVSSGNLKVQVPKTRSEGDLRSLTDTFNAMTRRLRSQRDEILANQEQIDQRRRFTEAVLTGVTAGVVGVSADGRVTIANEFALQLLGLKEAIVGEPLDATVPQLAQVVANAIEAGRREHREQITMMLEGRERTLDVQVSAEGDTADESSNAHVVTFDDITDLVSAQRSSAWADVARRIAHEIKNPLTPIQLSAERIRRRYGKRIEEDREVFDQCTDTIVRQVEDIKRMVDEFSSFARMPKPAVEEGDLREPLREAVFLQRVAHPEIKFEAELGDEPLPARFDARLIGQAFGNLVKNATEATEGFEYADGETPRIEVRARTDAGSVVVDIIDNGVGLPAENRQRLLEPYMTTREKGTGLGLAIVGKILEEHGATLALLDAPHVAEGGHGAMARVTLPVTGETAQEPGGITGTGKEPAETAGEGTSDGI